MDRTKSALDRDLASGTAPSKRSDLPPSPDTMSGVEERPRDSLTELGDWHAFHDCIRSAAILATENSRPLSLLVLSVDHLKDMTDNDAAWQGVLQRIAELLADIDQHGDCAARQGSAHFALILPDATITDATSLADHIRGRLLPQILEYAAGADDSLKIGTAEYDPQEPLGHFIQRATDALNS